MKLLQRRQSRSGLVGAAGRYSPIGVDVGSRQVKLVQLERARASRGWRLHVAATYPRAAAEQPFDQHEAQRLAEVLDRQGFAGRELVVGLPESRLMISTLELPPRSPNIPIDQIARMEVARVHQRDASTFEFAHWEIPSPARAARATHVMAAACAHDVAEPLLDVLEDQDLRIRALDAEPCALVRACRPLWRDDSAGGICAVLDLGWSASRLAIVHGGVIVYSRVIDQAALGQLHRSLGTELEIDQQTIAYLLAENYFTACGEAGAGSDEARAMIVAHFDLLIREINVALSYAAHQYPDVPLRRLLLTGGGAELPGAAEHLGVTLGVEATAVRPDTLVQAENSDDGCRSAAMVGALGLALYGQPDVDEPLKEGQA